MHVFSFFLLLQQDLHFSFSFFVNFFLASYSKSRLENMLALTMKYFFKLMIFFVKFNIYIDT